MNLESANLVALRYNAPPFSEYVLPPEMDVLDAYYGECGGEEMILTNYWLELDEPRQLYVVLHEIAHYRTSGNHDEAFYNYLSRLLRGNVSPDICREMEQVYPPGFPF